MFFFFSTTEVVTKSTPKILKENRPKNNRLSLSTPKKPSSHVRALNFETPVPRSQSESKANEKTIVRSPESIMKELKNACKSSLFQSPEITNVEIIEQNDLASENGKLQNLSFLLYIRIVYLRYNIKRYYFIYCIAGSENINSKILKKEQIISDNQATKQVVVPNENVSCKPDAIKVEASKKKSWDEDLRTICCQPTETEKEPSKKSKKKKKSKDSDKSKDKSDSKKSKKRDKSTPKTSKNGDKSTPNKSKKIDKKTSKKSKKRDKKTPKKSKKSEKSETSIDEKIVSTDETKIDIKKAEEMLMLPNSLEEMTVVPDSLIETSIVTNCLIETSIVPNSSEEIPIFTNSPEKTSIVPISSEDIPVLNNSSKEMPILSNSSEVTPRIPNSPKEEIVKNTNGEILSNSGLEALLSSGINEDDPISTADVMKLAAEEMDNLSKFSHNESMSNIVADTNYDIVQKMQHDEELMTAAFEDTTKNVSSNFFPEKEIESINHKKLKV